MLILFACFACFAFPLHYFTPTVHILKSTCSPESSKFALYNSHKYYPDHRHQVWFSPVSFLLCVWMVMKDFHNFLSRLYYVLCDSGRALTRKYWPSEHLTSCARQHQEQPTLGNPSGRRARGWALPAPSTPIRLHARAPSDCLMSISTPWARSHHHWNWQYRIPPGSFRL